MDNQPPTRHKGTKAATAKKEKTDFIIYWVSHPNNPKKQIFSFVLSY